MSNPGEDTLRLHCFPDIPAGDPGIGQLREDELRQFQRLDVSAVGPDCVVGHPNGHGRVRPNQAKRGKQQKEAYQQGFRDGHQKGLAEGEKRGYQAGEQVGFETASRQVEPLIQSLHESLAQLSQLRQALQDQIEHETVELALAIVRKIICHEAVIGRETILHVVQQALKHVVDDRPITIKMNPSDLQFLQDAKHRLSSRLSSLQHVSFDADESISAGGCAIETEWGKIDASLQNQLRALEEALRSQLPEAPHNSIRTR